ncbi:hypothetical protein HanIR_Chr12g0579821 [Helianthus annuus]|nr:hypothetical protein HanIR_Chr12g0579821 [Helianthus annuus]
MTPPWRMCNGVGGAVGLTWQGTWFHTGDLSTYTHHCTFIRHNKPSVAQPYMGFFPTNRLWWVNKNQNWLLLTLVFEEKERLGSVPKPCFDRFGFGLTIGTSFKA